MCICIWGIIGIGIHHWSDPPVCSKTVIWIESLMWFLSFGSQILQKKKKEITFSVEQDFVVTHPKPAPVKIYDYYETGRSFYFNQHEVWGRDRESKNTACVRDREPTLMELTLLWTVLGIGANARGKIHLTLASLGSCPRWQVDMTGKVWKCMSQNKGNFKNLQGSSN